MKLISIIQPSTLTEDSSKEQFKSMLKIFLPFARNILKLDKMPKIILKKTLSYSGQPTMGRFHNQEYMLELAIANRHPVDILRTLAHELVHAKQQREHIDIDPTTGSPDENEANILAGIIMREFNLKYPQYLKSQAISEGGNLSLPGGHEAQQIDLKVTNRSIIVPILNQVLGAINNGYAKTFKEPLWDPAVLKSGEFLSGSSLHFFNVKGIPDEQFVAKKPKVGDIDTQVDRNKVENLTSYLNSVQGKSIGPAKLLGYQKGNEQYSSLWELVDVPIKVQIDLEFVEYAKGKPTPWSQFSHSSSWDDLQAGIKGVFHKFLIQSISSLSQKEFLLRKLVGRGKARAEQDVPTTDNMVSFAVSSKEGGGLRAKYEPVLDDQGLPLIKDGLQVMRALPAEGYEQDIDKIFLTLFGDRLGPKQAKAMSQDFWSFTGLLNVMNKILSPEEKTTIVNSFISKIFDKGAQGLYKNDPQRDSQEKTAALNKLLQTFKTQAPDNLEQMKKDYLSTYKVTNESLTEADDKPNYARQGIQHIYNRLPDGRVSSVEMKDADFIELCKEIAQNGGTLNGVPINLKVDGAGIRFGKDESGRPFFMTSKVTTPLYADDIGYFTNYGKEKGQSPEQLARTKNYDNALSTIVNSRFIQSLPEDTIVQAEMLYNPMAEKVDGNLKFVNIPYDPKKLGKQMTLVPFMVKQYSTGENLPDADKVLKNLTASSDANIKIITNRLEQKGINVSKIIQPVLSLDPKNRKENKPILDKARQELSDAIINSPQLKGKDILGSNMEGIVVNMPSGRLVKVTSSQMKSAMAAKMSGGQTFGDTKPRTAVVAIGNFAGHKGHEQLINYAVEKANELNGKAFVFVGHKVGPDDPIDINTKIETLQKLFPGVPVSVVQNQIDPATGAETPGNIFKKIEYELIKKEPFYNNIIVTVGSDQAGISKTTDQMQGRYSKFPPLAHVKVSAYVTPRKSDEGGTGVSTTQLRNALKTMSEEEAFKVWSQAYNVKKLGADWIKHLMDVAKKNMGIKSVPQTKKQPPGRILNTLVKPKDQQEEPANEYQDRMAGVGMGNYIVDKNAMEDAAGVGVIASKKQAKDPRYSMSLTKDVRPGQVKKNLKAFKLESMLPKSAFAGTGAPDYHKLGSKAHLKGGSGGYAKPGDLVGEAPIELDPADPMDPMIYGHNKANPAKLKYRMMRASNQLKDLAARAPNASPAEWQSISAQFKELQMNIEQIEHALAELAKQRRKGGIKSRGIDPNIDEKLVSIGESWSKKIASLVEQLGKK